MEANSSFVPPLICSTPLLVPIRPNCSLAQLLTPCLAHSLLPSCAALFALLCAISIFVLGKLSEHSRQPLAMNKMLLAKSIVSALDLVASLLQLISIFGFAQVPALAAGGEARELHVEAIFNGLFSFCALLAYAECVRLGQLTSGCLHLLWLFRLVSVVPSALLAFDSGIFNSMALPNSLPLLVHLFCAISLTLLLCFADKKKAIILGVGQGQQYQRLAEPEEPEVHFKFKGAQEECSAASSLFYAYASQMIRVGLRGRVSYEQLWKLERRNQSEMLQKRFYSIYGLKPPKKGVEATNWDLCRLVWALLGTDWSFQLSCTLLILVFSLCQWSKALFLRLLVQWVNAGNPYWLCAAAISCLFAINVVGKLCEVRSDMQSFMTSYNVRTILIRLVSDKMMRLSASAKKDYSSGEVNNLINTDVERVRLCWWQLKYVPYCLLLGSISIVGLFNELGPNTLFGIGVIVAMLPINYLLTWFQANWEMAKMELTDSRLKLCNDVLAGMNVLKLYAWEESMERMIGKIRKPEVKKERMLSILGGFEVMSFHLTPVLATVLSFFGYTILQRRQLSPEVAFVSLLFFSILQFVVYILPGFVTSLVKALVSGKRLAKFLAQEELERERVIDGSSGGVDEDRQIVSLQNCSFTWGEAVQEEKEEPTKLQLQQISLQAGQGELVGIVGKVGSGKSSLLSAILGEMLLVDGQAKVWANAVGYVPQQPWIQNRTLRENVLFDEPFSEEHYQQVLEACALLDDLKQLPAGDKTEIGERGINLSGGQKARVALARAVYRHQSVDFFVLDDTLAAVDAHVAKHLFDRVIGPKGILREKTRLFALNTLAFLPQFDRILVLDGGKVSAMGKYEELIRLEEGPFAELMRQYVESLRQKEGRKEGEGVDIPKEQEEELDQLLASLSGSPLGHSIQSHFGHSQPKNEASANGTVGDGATGTKKEMGQQNGELAERPDGISHRAVHLADGVGPSIEASDGRLVDEEEMMIGQVSFKLYKDYALAFGPVISVAYLVSLFVGSAVFESLSRIWLAKWSTEAAHSSSSSVAENAWNLAIYGTLDGLLVLCSGISCAILAFGSYRASLHFHNRLVHSLFRSPMAFFERTPTGRIQNRLSRDIESVDAEIPWSLANLVMCLAAVLGTLVAICLVIPGLLLVAIPLLAIFIVIVRIYTKAAVQFRRLSSTSSSHLCSFVQDTYLGADSIRAFNALGRFQKLSSQVCDLSNECAMTDLTTNRWMQQRMNILGDFALFLCMLIASYMASIGSIPVGILAMIITAGANFTDYFGEISRAWRYAETQMVSVERIGTYIGNEPEAEWTLDTDSAIGRWPSHGHIQFHGVCLRYRANTELVLNQLTFDVRAGEKVGIVGRTGAGKSSMTLALFRIVEICGGQILVDGVDIATLGLHTLRRALTIIPQDPVLFCGTLRSNLDPFGEHEDIKLWEALEKAHLKEMVQEEAKKLDMEIADGGSNLSDGQRQLVCLARALLRAESTRILVLDEATAKIDADTDAKIQLTIRQHFAHCTLLTIAHRLNTILDYDRVLVMDKGQVLEFDAPQVLLDRSDSLFAGLAKQAGIGSSKNGADQ